MEVLRLAGVSDAPALLGIYAQYMDTPVTFEYALPSPEAFAARVRDILTFYPYLVWEEDGRILGYAYAHRQAERAAFDWNAELSVYLDRAAVGRGAGRRLYGALMELLTMQGVLTAHALVTSPNPASLPLNSPSRATASPSKAAALSYSAYCRNSPKRSIIISVRSLSFNIKNS